MSSCSMVSLNGTSKRLHGNGARARALVTTSLLAGMAAAAGASASAAPLQPHRAVYDVELGEVAASAGITEATGRLVFEISGGDCEGYVVNSRFVTRVTDREGTTRVTDLRSNTFETMDPPQFEFMNQTFADDAMQSEVKGSAQSRSSGLRVTRTEPKSATLTLDRAIFPTAHTQLILDAAAAGERVLEAPLYDGGDEADTVYDTTTVIGQPRTGLPGAGEGERAALGAIDGAEDLTGHRLVISYFKDAGTGGELTPEYELAFTLLENGISYDVTFDYESFSLNGTLTDLELQPLPDC